MNTKFPWIGYIQEIIRRYPSRLKIYNSLGRIEKRETDAVADALKKLSFERDKAIKKKLIEMRYWRKNRKPLKLIAKELYISESVAKKWHGNFLKTVAKNLDLYEPEE